LKGGAYVRFFEFPIRRTDEPDEGQLQFIEAERHVPFPVRRVYFSTGASTGCVRGKHAHRALEQVLICVHGEIRVMLEEGGERSTCVLDDPAVGLYVGPMTWHTMTWIEDDSVLLVLASDYYDEADYIRDYGEFLRLSGRTP
jgi:dTDP-4-dehydrorhamnose 3,5-epimerase-like enzyme